MGTVAKSVQVSKEIWADLFRFFWQELFSLYIIDKCEWVYFFKANESYAIHPAILVVVRSHIAESF